MRRAQDGGGGPGQCRPPRSRTVGLEVVPLPLCVVSSLLRHLGVMTSETLARAGTRGRPVVQEARVAEGRGMTGCGCPRC